MSSNLKNDDLRRCSSENKYWIDKTREIWKKDPDPLNKKRQYYLQKRSEVLAYVKETYSLDVKELKTRVRELDQQREQQPSHHIAESQKFNRYEKPSFNSNEGMERQPAKSFKERYSEKIQERKHEREQRPSRDYDFEKDR